MIQRLQNICGSSYKGIIKNPETLWSRPILVTSIKHPKQQAAFCIEQEAACSIFVEVEIYYKIGYMGGNLVDHSYKA